MKKLLSLLLMSGLMLGACSPEGEEVDTVSTNQGDGVAVEELDTTIAESISDERVDATQVEEANSSQKLFDGYRLIEVD